MARISVCIVVALSAAGIVAADPRVLPVKSVRHVDYNMHTGTWRFVDADRQRLDESIWASTFWTGYFFPTNWGFGVETLVLDWGDIAYGSRVTQFAFAYATDNQTEPEKVDIVFFNDENGFNNTYGRRVPVSAFRFRDLPNAAGYNVPNGYGVAFVITTISPKDPNHPEAAITPFVLDGNDLDPPPPVCPEDRSVFRCWPDCPFSARWLCVCGFGIGLSDFGYSEHYRAWQPGDRGIGAGPLLAWSDPNGVCTAFGIRHSFDAFSEDPNNPFDPNAIIRPEDGIYFGHFWPPDPGPPFPFAQWYLELLTNDSVPRCPRDPERRCERSDLEGDCVVGLEDLAVLLGAYGVSDGGDIDGDGDTDAGDLAILLADYGTDCSD